ncbi:IS66 family insertion sequence element accessory protein TnpB [Hornefia butyriciproducens]
MASKMIFLFCGRRSDRIKVLVWKGNRRNVDTL